MKGWTLDLIKFSEFRFRMTFEEFAARFFRSPHFALYASGRIPLLKAVVTFITHREVDGGLDCSADLDTATFNQLLTFIHQQYRDQTSIHHART